MSDTGANRAPNQADRLHVLIVDDDEANRVMLSRMLKRLGHGFDTAAGGVEAVTMATLVDYDVILMDVEMPGINGLQATTRIREAGQRATHIIGLSGHVDEETREASLRAGMDRYLTKPVFFENLVELLASLTSPNGNHTRSP